MKKDRKVRKNAGKYGKHGRIWKNVQTWWNIVVKQPIWRDTNVSMADFCWVWILPSTSPSGRGSTKHAAEVLEGNHGVCSQGLIHHFLQIFLDGGWTPQDEKPKVRAQESVYDVHWIVVDAFQRCLLRVKNKPTALSLRKSKLYCSNVQ